MEENPEPRLQNKGKSASKINQKANFIEFAVNGKINPFKKCSNKYSLLSLMRLV